MKYVYLIQSLENSCFKIGISKNPQKRIKQLKTGNSSDLKLIDSFYSKHPYKLEKFLQRHYNYAKKEGEWFELPLTEAFSFMKKCEKFEENILILEKNNDFLI